MTGMKKSIVIALLTALPIEIANMFFCRGPIELGLPVDAGLFKQLVLAEWVILHFPAFWLFEWIDRSGHLSLAAPAFFLCGYFDAALLILLGIYVCGVARRLVRRNHAATVRRNHAAAV